MTSLTKRILGLTTAGAAGLAIFMPGQADAAIMCTFGTLGSCSGTVGKLSFSNFQATGSYEAGDTIGITLSPTSGVYVIANNYNSGAAPNSLTGTGSLMFDVAAAAPGYVLLTASANADTLNQGTPLFTFTSALTGLSSNLVSTGGTAGPNTFNTGVTSTSATISWAQGNTSNEAYASSLRLTTNPPSIEVPGPLPILGAGAMFGFSRRLRRRVSSSNPA
jgi:hypothetical protein